MTLKPPGYKKRLIDPKIAELMSIYGAVCLEGPKWCGKTWASRNYCASGLFIGDPTGNYSNKRLAEMDPSLVLEGEQPRLIDEWQDVPAIWDAVKFTVDQTGKKNQFLLTGSSTPKIDSKQHSGTGRICTLRMRTMSLYESGHSSGVVSLMSLFNDSLQSTPVSKATLDDLIAYAVKGGWPGIQDLPLKQAMQIPIDYLKNVHEDMERSEGKKKDAKKVAALLRALGRAESTMTSKKSLQRDMEEFADDRDNASKASAQTINDYLDCFNRLFLIEDQPIFENKLRSSVKALKKPKRHFSDPSLAVAAIGATPEMLKQDINTFGYLFEALCVRDLRIYSEFHGGKVYHYHDEQENKVDAIVQLQDGRWGLFEIKLGFNQIDAAAKNLLQLEAKFLKETKSKPSFSCVICGLSQAAFKRPDGVFVVPITALGV